MHTHARMGSETCGRRQEPTPRSRPALQLTHQPTHQLQPGYFKKSFFLKTCCLRCDTANTHPTSTLACVHMQTHQSGWKACYLRPICQHSHHHPSKGDKPNKPSYQPKKPISKLFKEICAMFFRNKYPSRRASTFTNRFLVWNVLELRAQRHECHLWNEVTAIDFLCMRTAGRRQKAGPQGGLPH